MFVVQFFLVFRTGLSLTPPPLTIEIIITVCHEKGRHPLPPNRYVLFERPILERIKKHRPQNNQNQRQSHILWNVKKIKTVLENPFFKQALWACFLGQFLSLMTKKKVEVSQ